MPPSQDRWKFSPPNAPDLFFRHRLLKQFNDNREKQLILVVGQAGQGKSTLIAKAITSATRPAVWVNLDPFDADPASFMTSLITAFQDNWASLDFTPVINDLSTPVSDSKRQTIYFSWSVAFWQLAPSPVRLVLDVLEQIPDGSHTYLLIDALVRSAPKSVQFCLISRRRPPLKIERLKLEHRAVVFENDILALNLEETASFLRQTHLPTLSDDVINYIHAYTEGWLVGILILAHWLSGKQRHIQLKDLEVLFSRSVPSEIFNYFAEEVFDAFTQSDQQFLIQTAVLDVLDPVLIDKLLDMDGSAAKLQRLSRDYVFIQPFTDRSGQLFFRNHQLFKRFLDSASKDKLSSSVRRRMYLQAADHYASGGLIEKSLPYYLKARRYIQAGDILATIGMKLISRGQTEQLAGYLKQIPAAERQKSAWILLFEALMLRAKQSPQALDNLSRCREMFASSNDNNGRTLTSAYLIETAFLFGHSPIDMDQLLNEARAILAEAKDVASGFQAQLWLQIGFATIRGMGHFSEALSACQTAFQLAQSDRNINMQCHSLSLSKLACAYLGEFDQADDLDRQIEVLLPECSTEIKTFHLSSQCLLNIYRGRKKEALANLRQFEAEIEKYGFHHFYAWLTIYKCLVYPRVGKLAEAEKILAGWLQVCTEPTFRRAMALLFVGFCAYFRSAVVEGTAALQEAAEIFKKGPLRSEFQYHAALKGLGIAAYLRHDYAEAAVILHEVLAYAYSINSHTLIADAHLLIGLNQYAARELRAAGRHLRAAFDIVTTRRLDQLVVTHSDDLSCACLLALKLGVLDDWSWVRQILAKNANAAIVAELKEEIRNTQRAGRRRVLQECLGAIIEAELPRLEIRTFNELSILMDGEPIPASQWKGASSKRFLAMLLACGGRRVPKDSIMDALWPDSPVEAAHSNFKSALHRLRKVIEPRKERYQRAHYLHVRHNQVGFNPSHCRIDFEEFEAAAHKALRASDENQGSRMALEAVQMYKGPFLPDELYLPAITRQREQLTKVYLRLIERLCRQFEKSGEYHRAVDYLEKWLAVDPYSETACRRLMRLHSRSGRLGEALRLFRSFEALLQKDLQLSPDSKTQILFREIANQAGKLPGPQT
jgi:LuxR family maltose regulon positive regulatory protein